MKPLTLRPAQLERDFGQLAALFSLEQDEPTSEPGLKVDYEKHKERIIRLMVAEDEQGELLGFNWATRSRFDKNQAYFYIIVKPEDRGQGIGRRLYEDLEKSARAAQVKHLEISIRDNFPECRTFAERRGFTERSHTIGMALDLNTFEDWRYNEQIARLQEEGFLFTSMAALGNTVEAQRSLYALNDMTAMEMPGSEGEHPWLSFDDFQKHVCQADWYKPAGQMLAIDSATGNWAAMSAITRFEEADYAYNLHTGVDKRYRGHKLAQAVKVLALRYAQEVLKVNTVRTHHNSHNLPMIAIDCKLGYVQTSGIFSMEKTLEQHINEFGTKSPLFITRRDQPLEQHMPAIRLDAVLFASPDPEALATFYQQGFELEPPKWHGQDHLGLNLSNTYLGFDRTKDSQATPSGSVSIWFKVSDIEATFERLVNLGAKVKYAPTTEESPGEILALVYDPDGNSLGLISSA